MNFFLDTNLIKTYLSTFQNYSSTYKYTNLHTKLTQQITIQCVWYKTGAKITFDGTLRLPDKQ